MAEKVIFDYGLKTVSEGIFGTKNKSDKPEPDEQQGGKKKKKLKKGGDEDEVKDTTDEFDPIKEIWRAFEMEGGNKKKQTFLENKSNLAFIALGMWILFKIYKNNK